MHQVVKCLSVYPEKPREWPTTALDRFGYPLQGCFIYVVKYFLTNLEKYACINQLTTQNKSSEYLKLDYEAKHLYKI